MFRSSMEMENTAPPVKAVDPEYANSPPKSLYRSTPVKFSPVKGKASPARVVLREVSPLKVRTTYLENVKSSLRNNYYGFDFMEIRF